MEKRELMLSKHLLSEGREGILRGRRQAYHQGSRKGAEISRASQGQLEHVQSSMLLCTMHELCLAEYRSPAWGRDLSMVMKQR